MDSFERAKRAVYIKGLRSILKTTSAADPSPAGRAAAAQLDRDLAGLMPGRTTRKSNRNRWRRL